MSSSSTTIDADNEWNSLYGGLDQLSYRTEEQKKKRSSFLNDLDSFSSDFETQSKHHSLQQINSDTLLNKINETSSLFEAPSSQLANISMYPTKNVPINIEQKLIIDDHQKGNGHEKNQDDGYTKLTSSLFNDTESNILPKREVSNGISYEMNNKDDLVPNEKNDSDTHNSSDLGNFLTSDDRNNLTAEEIADWRCKQDDLTTKRKDYHGAVTYAFGGIFGWEMYGSVEATDDTGRTYTEYLMRIQWGKTWSNMQPFICGRRFSEFEILHYEITNSFPNLFHSLAPFPEKDFFRFLAPEVIQKRRFMIEAYMSTIVSSLPTIVHSPIFMEFLNLSRIEIIRRNIAISEPTVVNTISSNQQPTVDSIQNLDWTLDKAETCRLEMNANALDDNELGRLEESVRELGRLWKLEDSVQNIIKSVYIRNLIQDFIKKWPNLRATASVESTEVNLALIPRALQVEEDFINYLNEYRSIKAAYS